MQEQFRFDAERESNLRKRRELIGKIRSGNLDTNQAKVLGYLMRVDRATNYELIEQSGGGTEAIRRLRELRRMEFSIHKDRKMSSDGRATGTFYYSIAWETKNKYLSTGG